MDEYNFNEEKQFTNPPENKGNNGMSIAGLVLGIISIPANCCYGIGTFCAIIGLILSIVGNKKNKSGMGTAALVLNIIGIVLGILAIVYYAVSIIAMVRSGQFQDIINQAMNQYNY